MMQTNISDNLLNLCHQRSIKYTNEIIQKDTNSQPW